MTNAYDLFREAGEKKTKQLKRRLMGRFGSEATVSHDDLVEILQQEGIAGSPTESGLAVMALDHQWIPLGPGMFGNKYLLFKDSDDKSVYKVSVVSDFLYDGEI